MAREVPRAGMSEARCVGTSGGFRMLATYENLQSRDVPSSPVLSRACAEVNDHGDAEGMSE